MLTQAPSLTRQQQILLLTCRSSFPFVYTCTLTEVNCQSANFTSNVRKTQAQFANFIQDLEAETKVVNPNFPE